MAATKKLASFEYPGPLDPSSRRIEIDEFVVDEPMTNLFLLALRHMENVKLKSISDTTQDDWFSYYNLSGIHGFPVELWNGVPNKPPAVDTNDANNATLYCTHGSIVFPSWHRMQMLTLEQAIYRTMVDIAFQFESSDDQKHYLAATKRYRLPYWDVVLPRNPQNSSPDENKRIRSVFGMPAILNAEHVFVMDPKMGKIQISNPLHHFNFPAAAEFNKTGREPIYWDQLGLPKTASTLTLRCPTAAGQSNANALDLRIRSQAQNIMTTLWQLLNPGPRQDSVAQGSQAAGQWDPTKSNNDRPFSVFANHSSPDGWNDSVSLESWHDNIHVLVGSGSQSGASGHMGVIPVASFDPVFWLHHNNIERLFALYQALYEQLPDKFVPDDFVDGNTVKASSELSPFVKAAGSHCHTSNDVRDWTKLNYAVPGTKHLNEAERNALAKSLRATYYWGTEMREPPANLPHPQSMKDVFELTGQNFSFGPQHPVTFLALEKTPEQQVATIQLKSFPVESAKPPTSTPVNLTFKSEATNEKIYPEGAIADPEKKQMRTWNALFKVRKYAFHGSFLIQVFIGKNKVPDASQGPAYFLTRNEVGFSGILAYDPDGHCDNCQHNRDMLYGDVIPLTTELPSYLISNQAGPDVGPPPELRTLRSLEPDDVVPFLRDNIEWRIVDLSGNVKSAQEVVASGLSLSVADRSFAFPTDAEPLGVYGAYTVHPEITIGKDGGFQG